ncbi:MAG: PDZ domain-containing protein [Verrucomicrobia bacterium]|nr:PDZ domain-containing protein [Verrucomicrobiota bacterium]
MSAKLLLPALVLALIARTLGDQTLETAYRTTGPTVLAAFDAQRQIIQKSSAVIYDGRSEAAYGVVISPDGDILTKASEFQDIKHPTVAVDATHYAEVKLITVDPRWDVAHVKIEASGLTPVNFAPTSAVPQGTWVVANGASTRTHRRVLAGIVSAKIREIPTAGGAALGVILKLDAKELEIADVQDKSGAKEAGLRKGDVILAVDGKPVGKREDVTAALKDLKAGTTAKVTYRRNDAELTVEVRLMALNEMTDLMNRNDQMSGLFSERRSGFPRILQHDILGAKSVVGGPLLDLDGRCIGMNIARANRAESFAIPVEDLKALAERMLKPASN